ncbi:hypothetical protein BDN67DRAFT_1012112 [Paxillus ammoniavirescens]|nr:hypothetical protein BDN67DRAFT_1012112 [Paxillus ammoniavirescens]
MSEDDAAYTALLTQLLSDTSTTRNARVHSWIEHQYDFALSEQDCLAKSTDPSYSSVANSRSPSPSPSSSLGAHRTFSIDRPDSPLLPRFSTERPSSPRTDPCPSYDALFFPTPQALSEDDEREERERERALRFLIQEMANWKMQSFPGTPHKNTDKPLPAPPPPSPASSTTQSTSSRVLRSRSSSMRISRLPSFTSTLSSDQSQPKDIFTHSPVSVIIHGESHHELVLRRDHPLADSYLPQLGDSFTHQLFQSQAQELQLLSPLQDDKDSGYPSPTLSNFSCAYSRETSLTTPYTSFPASPASATFAPSACSPEDIALPASPMDERQFFGDESSALPVSPVTNVLPASPRSSYFPAAVTAEADMAAQLHLRAPKSGLHSQSRWSIATTASLTPSPSEPKSGSFLSPRTPSKGKKDKELKTPRKRARFISLISRFSPGRSEASSTTTSTAAEEYDSANESDAEEGKDEDKGKQKKGVSKKSSLASLRASFSLSRASFSSQRPPLSSPTEEVPPLPTSPTRTSFSASRPSLTDGGVLSEVVPPVPKLPLSRIPSRSNLLDANLPPIPQSASTITSFHSSSHISIPQSPATSASASRISLFSPNANHSASRISLIPPPSKRTSLASAAGIEAPISIHPMTSSETPARSKSIFRLSTKSRTPKTRAVSGPPPKATPSKLPVRGNASLLSPMNTSPQLSSAPPKFTPPAKLASVLANQSQRAAPMPTSPSSAPPIIKLPTPPSRTTSASRLPRSPPATKVSMVVTDTKLSTDDLSSMTLASKLPLPASKGARVGTVRGFWRRQ